MTTFESEVEAALESLEVELSGLLMLESGQVYIFEDEIQGFKVNGALFITPDSEQPIYYMNARFAICAEDDTYKREVGSSLALGRVLKVDGYDANMGGEMPFQTGIEAYLGTKLTKLSNALAFKRSAEQIVKRSEDYIHSEIGDRLSEFV